LAAPAFGLPAGPGSRRDHAAADIHAGFNAVAVRADWPDAYRMNRFVRGVSYDSDANTALGDFRRFPAWMWRNTEVLRLVEGLRGWNTFGV
jgi:erythromycin esterase-like protein